MVKATPLLSRRRIIAATAASAAASAIGAPAWAALLPTARQTAGPFYPRTKPLDSDNDLVIVSGRSGRAKGTILHLGGRILDAHGRPVHGARVEIWQCDAFGRYHHPRDGGGADPNFQGFGQNATGADGVYRFRTIRPVRYTGRTPHIHFAVFGDGFDRLTTQMYVAGEPDNASDGILNSVRDPKARNALIVALAPAADAEPDALAGLFDIVVSR